MTDRYKGPYPVFKEEKSHKHKYSKNTNTLSAISRLWPLTLCCMCSCSVPELLRQFLSTFVSPTSDDDPTPKHVYLQQLQSIVNHESRVLSVSVDHVREFFSTVPAATTIVHGIVNNALRYQRLLYKAADRLIKGMSPTTPASEMKYDSNDIWMQHRAARLRDVTGVENIPQSNESNAPNAVPPAAAAAPMNDDIDSDDEAPAAPPGAPVGAGAAANALNPDKVFPKELLRRYEIQLIASSEDKISTMRDIGAEVVGSLVSVRGLITRVTDVAPLVQVATYLCTTCGWETYQVINDRSFQPLRLCPSTTCQNNNRIGRLILQTRASKFTPYQSVKLQELPSQVPVGHIPRSLNMRLYGNLTRSVKPGDEVTVTGIFLPTPHTGYRAIRAGLTADVYLEVTHLIPAKQQYNEITLTHDMLNTIEQHSRSGTIYETLAGSIAPELYGLTDIKKALLLLLVSGVTQTLSDGLKIRGDLNILLLGDPGVAKSQLLKHIAHIAPRGVYTTGKGSSGVGLTAAVLRDPVTGDMTLEGGSLVLADKGVCCIDEFDKMEEGDRTALHEVMEQQTVSIAKAGITTTLNARTAVLAAANPAYGRWNPQKSAEANLNFPTSLLSRFDLMFIILDRPNMERDSQLAEHVTYVHRTSTHPTLEYEPLNAEFLRNYISHARTFKPPIPMSLMDDIVGHYVGLRQEDEQSTQQHALTHPTTTGNTTGASGATNAAAAAAAPMLSYAQRRQNTRQRFVTPRSLLSILRLAQAHARLHLKETVDQQDVHEAIRLVYMSKASQSADDDGTRRNKRMDVDSEIYMLIQQLRSQTGWNRIERKQVTNTVTSHGYTPEQLQHCLDRYEALNVWVANRAHVTFIGGETEREVGQRGREQRQRMEQTDMEIEP